MEVKYETGYAIEKDVEIVINSANGLLNADSTGAGAIREASEDLSETDRYEFDKLFSKAPIGVQELFEQKREKHGWYYQHENLSCLKLLAINNYKTYEIGTAIYDPLWSEKSTKQVIHAITLTYDPKTKERIVGTPEQIQKAVSEAVELALDLDKKTISLPVPCARPAYGLGPEKSYTLVKEALKKFDHEDVTVILCFDNEQTQEFLKSIK